MGRERKFFVGGNWKCNGSREFVVSSSEQLNHLLPASSSVEIVIAPPALYLHQLRELLRADVGIASQNVWHSKGAFTGEWTAEQAKDVGANWTIVGHSERRTLFGDSDELVFFSNDGPK